jgi:Uma2 family endonuclease
MAVATHLITAEEYARLPDQGYPTELVRGEIVRMNLPRPRHGQVCSKIVQIIGPFADQHDLGHVVCNDSGVITERDPDTVRGGDVWFISFAKIPRGPFPEGYIEVPPDVVFEVRSPSDRKGKLLAKVGEYLEAGVGVVCVLNPQTGTLHLYGEDKDEELQGDDELTIPDHLPGLRVPVRRFFE